MGYQVVYTPEEMEHIKRTGRIIAGGMVERGMTREELADALGVSRYTVSRWISGRVGISLTLAVRVCDFFGWPLDRICARGDWAA